MKIQVSANVLNEADYSNGDYAEVEIEDPLKGTILDFKNMITGTKADQICMYDYTPIFHLDFLDPQVEFSKLIVNKSGFLWSAKLKFSGKWVETNHMPFTVLEGPNAQDLRETDDANEG